MMLKRILIEKDPRPLVEALARWEAGTVPEPVSFPAGVSPDEAARFLESHPEAQNAVMALAGTEDCSFTLCPATQAPDGLAAYERNLCPLFSHVTRLKSPNFPLRLEVSAPTPLAVRQYQRLRERGFVSPFLLLLERHRNCQGGSGPYRLFQAVVETGPAPSPSDAFLESLRTALKERPYVPLNLIGFSREEIETSTEAAALLAPFPHAYLLFSGDGLSAGAYLLQEPIPQE